MTTPGPPVSGGADTIRRAATREPAGRLSRDQIADRLTEMADLLEAQGADRFRVRAYRQGAATVRSLDEAPVRILARGGLKGLTDLRNIGPSLARARIRLGASFRDRTVAAP